MFNRVKKIFVIILMAVVMSALAGCGAAKSANAAEQEKNVVDIAIHSVLIMG